LTAFAKELGMSEDELLRVASAFGGGIGRQQLTCGAVTGAAMAIGLRFGKGIHDSDDNKQNTYDKTVELFAEFIRLHGSTNCRELLDNLDMRDENDHNTIIEKDLFHANCRKYVGDAVKIADQLINNPQ
jgi:C_GCAxxG_C_C family probable redox protein